MADWKSTVRLGDISHEYRNGDITIQELGKKLAERLKKNKFSSDWTIVDIIEGLENVEDVEDYDCWLNELYNYGDAGHRIWVDPFLPKEKKAVSNG